MMRLAFLAFLCLQAAPAQTAPSELLKQIQLRVAGSLAHLPNYTCRQTIERFSRPADSKRFILQDRLRLDVALIEGKELYAWPGSPRFEDKAIFDVVGGGAVGSGNFATHLRNLFLKPGAQFTLVGKEEMAGQKAWRFDFRVPLERSEFTIREGSERAIVGYYGSIWADGETFDLLRLEANVDQIPPPLTITKSADVIEYGRVRIGGADFMLPKTAEMTLFSPVVDNRNVTHFEGCRQYVGESVLSFVDPQTAADAAKPVEKVNLPAGLNVEMNLATPIDKEKSAVGDELTAVLYRPLRLDGKILLPKGAHFHGRISRMELRRTTALTYHVIGVLLDSVEAQGRRGEFHGVLEDAGLTINASFHVPYQRNPGRQFNIWTNFRHETALPKPDEGVFYVRGDILRLTPGMRLLWRTAAP